jgi:hypothetical protein
MMFLFRISAIAIYVPVQRLFNEHRVCACIGSFLCAQIVINRQFKMVSQMLNDDVAVRNLTTI